MPLPPQQPDPNIWAQAPPIQSAPLDALHGYTPMPAAAASPAPKMAAQPMDPGQQQIQNDQQRLEKIRWQQENPWGTPDNHPGKLGKIAHAFSTLGNITGDIFAPSTMALIPGTQLNREAQEGGLAKRLNTEIGDESENTYRGAETAGKEEETKEAPEKAASLEAEQEAQATNLKSETTARDAEQSMGPSLAAGYSHAVNEAIKAGRDPATDPIVQHLSDAITSIQKQATPKNDEAKTTDLIGPDGKEHTMGWDDKTKKYDVDMGLKGEKPPVVNVNAGNAELDRASGRLGKPYQTAYDAGNKTLERMELTRRNVDAGYVGQALAIPELLTALVSGQGTGVRVTQAELSSILAHRGIKGSVESFFNGLTGKGQLNAQDKAQIKGVLQDAEQRLRTKMEINSAALDAINGGASRGDIVKADHDARQHLNEVEQYGFYTGQKIAQGTVVGFKNGKVQVDDAR